MKFNLSFFILFFLPFDSYTQSVKINGMVVDALSKKELTGATVEIGHSKAIANTKGTFELTTTKQELEKGMKISYIGYTTSILENVNSNKFLFIELASTSNTLPEIVLSNEGLAIVQKAIAAIEKNYPLKPYYNYCTQWITSVVNEDDYLLYDTAQLKLYVPSYSDKNDPVQMQLLSNKRKEFEKDSKKRYRDSQGFSYAISARDFVHNRNFIADEKKLDHYLFSLKGTINYKDRRMYVIDFFRKKNRSGRDGTLLIDSLTYAFAAVTCVPNDKEKSNKALFKGYKDFFQFLRYEYEFKEGSWFFTVFRVEQHQRIFDLATMKTNFYSLVLDALSTHIDTTNAIPIDKKDRIKSTDKLKNVNKPGTEL